MKFFIYLEIILLDLRRNHNSNFLSRSLRSISCINEEQASDSDSSYDDDDDDENKPTYYEKDGKKILTEKGKKEMYHREILNKRPEDLLLPKNIPFYKHLIDPTKDLKKYLKSNDEIGGWGGKSYPLTAYYR